LFTSSNPHTPRFVRLAETRRARLAFTLDGVSASALAGDTLLVAVLMHQGHLRTSEFDDSPRAGFCLMGACQDCWMWTGDGDRVRACTTPVHDGMQVFTRPPRDEWGTLVVFSAGLASSPEDA